MTTDVRTSASQLALDDLVDAADGRVPNEIKTKLAAFSPTAWVQAFAMMLASNVSIDQCCVRLDKPRRMLDGMLAMPEFQELVKSIAHESSKDVAGELLKGAGVDNILFLITTRDNPQVAWRERINCAKFLLQLKFSDKALAQGGLGEVLKRHNGDLNGSLDAEITRLIKNSPNLSRDYSDLLPNDRATVPANS